MQESQQYNISRFTLHRWFKHYEAFGEAGLVNLSSKHKTFPTQKINVLSERLILDRRKTRKLGVRRMQTELKRLHNLSFSLKTIHKVNKT